MLAAAMSLIPEYDFLITKYKNVSHAIMENNIFCSISISTLLEIYGSPERRDNVSKTNPTIINLYMILPISSMDGNEFNKEEF